MIVLPKQYPNTICKEPCPVCNSREFVGTFDGFNRTTGRYFCSECYIEFKIHTNRIDVYEITADGKTVLIKVIEK